MPESPAESIFAAAAGLTAHARDAFLAAACGENADLRRKVNRLLAAHAAADGFLDQPAADAYAPTGDLDPTGHHEPSDGEGSVLAGRYKLVERIGEGGMGSVWMAQQTEPVKRAVAVKLIRAGMDSKAVLNRFEAERQALAMMDHPNIARVFDAGLSGGCPFFVMELVKGVPITRFCDDRKLTPRQRLELFVPVCQAIQHAHQKGIIHRDIKPTNVLVALYDDRPVPKVIDFGVAKAAGQPLTDKTLMTGYGAVVGTPEYMSPEQASFNQLDVDTRSDVYSLGVLLYELLTGSPPFPQKELKQAGLLEMLRVVREQEPPRPSARLSTAAALPSLAAVRGTEPRALMQLLRSELDWVVMKALEKDRARRYDTPNGFAADVLRYLSGEAVQAVPPSVGYRVRKWVRRNRGVVISTLAVLGGIVFALVGQTVNLFQAKEAERRASEAEANERVERQRAEEALKREQVLRRTAKLGEMMAEVDADLKLCNDTWARSNAALARLARRLEQLPADAGPYREYLAMTLIALGQGYAPLVPTLVSGRGTESGTGITPDGRVVLTCKDGPEYGAAYLWDSTTGRQIAVLQHGSERVWRAEFSADGRTAYTVGLNGIVRFWDVPSGRFRAQTEPMKVLAGRDGTFENNQHLLSADGRRMVTVTASGKTWADVWEVHLWDGSTGRPIARLDRDSEKLTSVKLSPDDRFVAAIGRQLVVWSALDGRELHRGEPEDRPQVVAFSPSGRRAVSGSSERTYWWDTAKWNPSHVNSPGSFFSYRAPDPIYATEDLLVQWESKEVNGWIEEGGCGQCKLLYHAGAAPGREISTQLRSPETDATAVPVRADKKVVAFGPVALDAETLETLPVPAGRTYHPALARFAHDNRWLPINGDLIDLAADRRLVTVWGEPTVLVPGVGFVGVDDIYAGNGEDATQVCWLPLPSRLPPVDLIALWVRVAIRGECGPTGEFMPWDEQTWERHRAMLAARPAPHTDFPFPGPLATDKLHWMKEQFYHNAGEAEDLRLARELLSRSEAAGDAAEVARWRREIDRRTRETAPPPRPVR